jgi:hypothetical protein
MRRGAGTASAAIRGSAPLAILLGQAEGLEELRGQIVARGGGRGRTARPNGAERTGGRPRGSPLALGLICPGLPALGFDLFLSAARVGDHRVARPGPRATPL